MCNIIKFDKNFKYDNKNSLIKYMYLFRDRFSVGHYSNDIDAMNELISLRMIYPNTKCFKVISNKDGSNERIYSLEVLS